MKKAKTTSWKQKWNDKKYNFVNNMYQKECRILGGEELFHVKEETLETPP